MTIVSECPHCESRFNLQPETLGKPLRCPNLSCRNIFTVALAPGSPPPSIVEAEVLDDGVVEAKVVDAEVVKPKIVDARVLKAKVVAAKVVDSKSPSPQEVDWATERLVPPSVAQARPVVEVGDDEPILRRRKKRGKPKLVIGALLGLIVALLGFGAYYIVGINIRSESKLAKQADSELKAGDFPGAARDYKQLLEEYPDSASAARYRFSADLAATRAMAQSVTNREDPFPALEKFQGFVTEHRESPFAKPQSGLGSDVFATGSKLIEDLSDYGRDHFGKFRTNRSQASELGRAERAAREGRKLLSSLEPFRDPEVLPSESLRTAFDKLDQDLRFERDRAVFLGELRDRLKEPTDESIATAESLATRRGLGSEADVQQILQDARTTLQTRVRYLASPAPPRSAPPVAGRSLLFASPIGRAVANVPTAGEIPGTFLAQARGILYALDERTGTLLWAERIGSDRQEPPTRHTPDDGSGDLALVTSDIAGESGLTVRRLRTGEPIWYQPLAARAAGPVVIVARRVYVPLRDPLGTIVEFDLASGARLGSLSLGQPLGPAAVHRTGTGLLYLAAEARRVFVVDVDARNDDGVRQEPRLVQVLTTGHPAGTVRVPPLVVGPVGLGAGPHWLILAQTDGPRSTRVRSFRLPEEGGVQAKLPEVALTAAAEPTILGWPWFPLACDGERLAVATDAGAFYLFGVSQPGDQDRPLFLMASVPPPKEEPREPQPGLVVSNGDDVDWVLSLRKWTQLRLTLVSARGQVLEPVGTPTLLGTPLQPAHTSRARDATFLVVREGGPRAVAWSLEKGEKNWERPLGLVPSDVPMVIEDRILLADEEGGLTILPRDALDPGTPGHRIADAAWRLALPPGHATGPTQLIPAREGLAVWAVTPHDSSFTIRRIQGGALTLDAKVNTMAPLAGRPIEWNRELLLPLASGEICRLDVKNRRLVPGPQWRDARSSADAACFLTAGPGDEFLSTDGHREIRRWQWPVESSEWKRVGERILARESIAVAPLLLNAGKDGRPAVLFADRTGSVWLHDLASGEVVRRWRSGGANVLPAGLPTSRFTQLPGGAVAFTVEGRSLVVLDPLGEITPRVAMVPSGPPGVAFVGGPTITMAGNWLLTDTAGRTIEFDQGTLEVGKVRPCGVSGALPIQGATVIDAGTILIPLADGSLSVITIDEAKPMAQAPLPRRVDEK